MLFLPKVYKQNIIKKVSRQIAAYSKHSPNKQKQKTGFLAYPKVKHSYENFHKLKWGKARRNHLRTQLANKYTK